MAKKLKIGFDFDGVIAYNPLRILRAPGNFLSKIFFKKKIIGYYPKSKLEQIFWRLLHKTSHFPSYGFSELREMLKNGDIEAYLITGRYSLLEDSLKHWLKRNKADKLFKGYFVNNKNQHPHEFKEKMITKLGLDAFVEDNWDIVDYLNVKCQMSNVKCKVYWIYNLLDRFKPYDKKHPHLKSFIKRIKSANSLPAQVGKS